MATNSPSSMEACLATSCFSSICCWSKKRHAPAPHGPGFPLHDPSVKANTSSVPFSVIMHVH